MVGARNGRVRTRCLPLVLVHLALAVGVDDVHALEELAKLLVLVVLLEDLVELLLVHRVQVVLGRQPDRVG